MTTRNTAVLVIALSWIGVAPSVIAQNAPLAQRFPSAHVLVHYYCPDCSDAEKDHVAAVASIINHGEPLTFEHLYPSHPEVDDLVNVRYRLVQYVQYMTLGGEPNATGAADLAGLDAFAADNGYDIEEFFLHWSEPTRVENLGGVVDFDGTTTELTDTASTSHALATDRAVAIVWGDFYYVFNWHSEAWRAYIAERTAAELGDLGGYAFDGLFEDVLNGPISDTYQGVVLGGGIAEFGGATPQEISDAGDDHALIAQAQGWLDAQLPGAILLPNSGNYTQDWALETMLAGDGTVTEMMNVPGSTLWKESWENAAAVAAAGDYYSLASYWDTDHVPADFPAGAYASALERAHLHNAAWYWMAYEPGHVAFDVSRACCDWSAQWPEVMEADLGAPIGAPAQIDSGTTEAGWHWTLWARPYEKATVFFRGNNAWRDGNDASIGYGEDTAATFSAAATFPAGAQMLRADGTWTEAPDAIAHMDAFGFVLRVMNGGAGDAGGDADADADSGTAPGGNGGSCSCTAAGSFARDHSGPLGILL
jgi:hypothetical protein